MFFDVDSAELTQSDRTALDSYAAKYVAARSTNPVKVEGWASMEGQASHNATLSKQRAQAVADYLTSKGIPKDKVSSQGLGPTSKFGKADLPPNRRATISPKPPAGTAPASPPAPAGPTPPPSPHVDLDPNSPANKKAIQDTIANVDEANDWIRKTLTANNLRPDPNDTSGDKVLYRNKTTATTDVIKETVNDGKKAPIKAPDMITPERVERIAGEILLAAAPGGGKMGGKSLLNIDIQIQYTFIPKTLHTPVKGGPGTADQPAHQLEFDIVAELHGKDESGIEITGKVNGTVFADEKGKQIKWQSVSGGAQIAWVQNFLDGNLQVSPQLQVTFGGSRAVMDKTQTIQWTPTGQISASAQALFKVPGFSGHLWVGWQATVSGTAPGGGPSTVDRNVGFMLVFQF